MLISNSSFVRSAIALLVVGFLTLLGIVGMTIWLGDRVQVYFNDVIEARDTRSAAVELRNAIQTAEASQRGFLITGNEIYLAPYTTAKTLAERQLGIVKRRLDAYVASNEALQRLKAIIANKFEEMDQTISLKRERRDADALTITRTNRGKALTDEANVFISGIIRKADERLTTGVGEQRANATRLRWVSIAGGVIIVLVVGIVIVTLFGYIRKLAEARDEVSMLNTNLEQRVKERTSDLAQARDRAELLLSEVNHRVANSLSLVASLVRLQANAVNDKVAKEVLAETQARIFAISSVHKRLYSSGDVRFVALDEYLSGLLEQLETSMRDEGHGASLKYELEPLKLQPDATISLGVVVAELVTNAFKYAYPHKSGEIRVRLKHLSHQQVELAVEDDGVGRSDGTPSKGTGLGTKIIKAMAANMQADIQYLKGEPGTTARLVFPLQS
ncbi:MAG: CHASE3 domain-containing protein [Pseudomonadota bacterium]